MRILLKTIQRGVYIEASIELRKEEIEGKREGEKEDRKKMINLACYFHISYHFIKVLNNLFYYLDH